ncbi:kinesin-like protein KIF3C [Coregonus clupeaformis]|uniref:kinesin-like protein KIF3C n=1 Tax=Coregonus clupeaformis TaxID=59861 RepID=UPI001E1C35A8|nr:kinesin-like protein KIF3C [Coregonus clupeaformis]
MSKVKSSETVKVVVRCRPLNRKEAAAAGVTGTPGGRGGIVEMDVHLGQVVLRNPRAPSGEPQKTFTFDSVYDTSSKQRDLYDETVRPLIDSVLDGFNGTIFAYGQTGTGKTYTRPESRGIIPNAFERVFTTEHQYLVRASYLEIYREEIRDLYNRL